MSFCPYSCEYEGMRSLLPTDAALEEHVYLLHHSAETAKCAAALRTASVGEGSEAITHTLNADRHHSVRLGSFRAAKLNSTHT